MFPADLRKPQGDRHTDIWSIPRGGRQRVFQAVQVILAEYREFFRIRRIIQAAGKRQRVRVVCHRDGARCRIIVELNAAGLLGKELGLDALGLECLNRTSDLRRRLLEQHFGRKLLRVRRAVRISLVRLEQTLPDLQ